MDRIRRCVAHRVGATDTAEGSARWWLADPAWKTDDPLVEAALERLAATRELDRVRLAGKIVVYRHR